jgi:hypothetical protein
LANRAHRGHALAKGARRSRSGALRQHKQRRSSDGLNLASFSWYFTCHFCPFIWMAVYILFASRFGHRCGGVVGRPRYCPMRQL